MRHCGGRRPHDYPQKHNHKSLSVLRGCDYQSVTNHSKEPQSACLSIEVRQMERIKLTLLPNNLLELCSFCVVTVIATHIHNLPLCRCEFRFRFRFLFFFFDSQLISLCLLCLPPVVFVLPAPHTQWIIPEQFCFHVANPKSD